MADRPDAGNAGMFLSFNYIKLTPQFLGPDTYRPSVHLLL